MNWKLTRQKDAAVDLHYEWQPLDTAPLGVKVQLLTIGRIAVHGKLDNKNRGSFLAWAPCPRIPKWLDD